MIKIVKTTSLTIKQGDILFDLNPEIYPKKSAGFEVVRFNTERGEMLCKALNERAELYDKNDEDEYPFFIESEFNWYKLKIEL